jgi:hypothetical protein
MRSSSPTGGSVKTPGQSLDLGLLAVRSESYGIRAPDVSSLWHGETTGRAPAERLNPRVARIDRGDWVWTRSRTTSITPSGSLGDVLGIARAVEEPCGTSRRLSLSPLASTFGRPRAGHRRSGSLRVLIQRRPEGLAPCRRSPARLWPRVRKPASRSNRATSSGCWRYQSRRTGWSKTSSRRLRSLPTWKASIRCPADSAVPTHHKRVQGSQ